MPFDIALKILRQSAEVGVSSVKLNYRGESTLHPKFYQVAYYAKALGFIDRLTNSNFKFQTNREDIFEGLCYQSKVKVSFDSFRKDIFEKQRAGGIFELALANVDKFYSHPNRKNTELVVQAVRTKLNADEDLEGFVRSRWPEATASIRDVVAGRLERDIGEYQNRERSTERQSCTQAHVRLIFDTEGNAQACCPDIGSKIKLGSINEMTVKQIFNSPAAKQLRKDLKTNKAFDREPCKSCSSYESYKGFKPVWNS